MRIEGPSITPDQGGQDRYQVQEGDTLQSIGSQFNISPDDLAKANGLPSDIKLTVGMELLLPAVQTAGQGTRGLADIADQLQPAVQDPGEQIGIKFHDAMPEIRPGEDIGIKFHDQMPEIRPGEDIGIKFHDAMPVNLTREMFSTNEAGQMLVNNENVANAFKSLNPDENMGIRFHDQLPGRGPEDIGIKFHDQIPGQESAGGETANIGLLPHFNADMFEVTGQGQVLIKNDDLARAFRSILDAGKGSVSMDLVPFNKTE